ncbi:Hypothetical predicted protein [Pelobates cultripes]|uniref:Uncharacterized protein n=1 Tax=Pelobates cultripes TaxID=61616 RepID=A0AAD1WBZ3_PELCU|nr:Hypothetical predicted protein [Pelobates cultripes]
MLAWPHGRAIVGECRRETCDSAAGSEGADSQERLRERRGTPSRQRRRAAPQQSRPPKETQEKTQKYGDPTFGAPEKSPGGPQTNEQKRKWQARTMEP